MYVIQVLIQSFTTPENWLRRRISHHRYRFYRMVQVPSNTFLNNTFTTTEGFTSNILELDSTEFTSLSAITCK